MSFNITIGKYGGFYIHRGNTFRICLGWIAFTFMKMELDEAFVTYAQSITKEMKEQVRQIKEIPLRTGGEVDAATYYQAKYQRIIWDADAKLDRAMRRIKSPKYVVKISKMK